MKKTFLTILQVAVTIGILVYIFRDPEQRREMVEAFRQVDPRWLLLGFGFYCVLMVAGMARWQVLLRAQGVVITWRRAAEIFMIGAFFNLFLFGVTGGDVARIYYIMKEAPDRKATAFFSVLIDRIIGLLGLMFLAVGAIGWRYHWLAQTEATKGLLWSLIFILAAGVGGIAFSFLLTGFGLAERLPARFPMRTKFIELSDAYHFYGKAWKSLLAAFGLALVVHVFFFSAFWAGARGLGVKVGYFDMCAMMPIVSTLQAMPVSLSGIGVREGLLAALMGDLCGVTRGVGASVGMVGTLIMILFGILGGPIYLFYRPSTGGRGKIDREELEKTAAYHPEHETGGDGPAADGARG